MDVGASLVVQWLRLHTPKARGPGLIPCQGTRPHMSQTMSSHATTKRSHVPQLRPGAAKQISILKRRQN